MIRLGVQQVMTVQLDRAAENINLLMELNQAETNILAKDSIIRTFSEGQLPREATATYLKKIMEEKNRVRNVYKNIFITSREGIIVATAMDNAQNLDLSERKYFKAARSTGKTVTSDILFARSDLESIIVTLTPIFDGNNSLVGFAGIALKATFFTEFMKSFSEDPNGYYIILDSNQLILSHPDKDRIAKHLGIREFTRETGEDWQSDSAGEYRFKQKILPQTGWRLLAVMNETAVEEKAASLLKATMVVGFVLILVAGLITYYLAKKISDPLETMIQAMNHASERQLRLRNQLPEAITLTNSKGMDEIQRLKTATVQLRRLIDSYDYSAVASSNRFKENIDALSREIEENHKRTYDFLSVLSHDMRTPLTLIKGYSRGIEQYGENSNMRNRYAEGILENTSDIEKLIYDVMDSAYEVNSGFAFELEPVDAGRFAEQVAQEALLGLIQGEQRLMVFVDGASVGTRVRIDTAKIRRVLFNLLSNASKYASAGTEIRFSLQKADASLRFSVKNQGPGIPEDETQKIFEMFFRGRGATGKGYGMGLHIASRIIKGHNSSLELVSNEKGETEFYFCLPEEVV